MNYDDLPLAWLMLLLEMSSMQINKAEKKTKKENQLKMDYWQKTKHSYS